MTKTRDQVIAEGTTCPCGSTATNPKAMNDTTEVDGFDCLVGSWDCLSCGQRFDGYEPNDPEDDPEEPMDMSGSTPGADR